MDYQTLIYEKKERIVRITINRPKVLNAINKLTIRELMMAFRQAQEDEEARVIILTGAGDRAFSTGHDLKESIGQGPDFYSPQNIWEWQKLAHDMLYTIWNSDKAVIARVDGYCLAISLDLALVCDFIIASEESKFGEPEIREGSISEFPMLPWVVGMMQAKYLLLTGDTISAEEALKMGIITKVVPKKELDTEVDKLARKLSNISPYAIKISKLGINKAYEAMGLTPTMAIVLGTSSFLGLVETDERKMWSKIKAEKGLKAAMEWRDSLFK